MQQTVNSNSLQPSWHQTTQMQTEPTPLNAASPISAFGADAYHSETRKVSSVVIESQALSNTEDTQDRVRYVEVPTIEEQVKYVTVYEKRVVEREEPEYYTEWVDKIVRVPKIEYVDIPNPEKRVVERRVEVKRPQIVERTREVPVEHKVYKSRQVQQTREVPGEIIEVPQYKDIPVETPVIRTVDREVPVIVAQTIKPIITESNTTHEVDVFDYEPEVMPVDVHIAKPIASALEVVGQRDLRHRLVNVTSGQYNTVLKMLNANASESTKASLPFVSEHGKIPFAPEHESHFIVAPPNVEIHGWSRPIIDQIQQQQREVASLGSNVMAGSQPANETACCRNRKKELSAVSSAPMQQRTQGGSEHHHRHHHSNAQTSEVYASSLHQHQQQQPSTHTGSQHRRPRQASQSQAYTEVFEELVKDGSTTVLSQRPHAKSRVCC